MNRTSLTLFLIIILLSTDVYAELKTKIAALNITPQGVDNSITDTISQVIASRLGEYDAFSVISRTEIKAMLSYEYEKQAMGCEDDISCLAEIGAAMGVDYIVAGSLGKMNRTFVLNLMLIKINESFVKNRISVSLKGDSSDLIELVSPYVKKLVEGEKASKYKGSVDILVNESEASVLINSKKIGTTPLKEQIQLPIGKHSIFVRKSGYSDYKTDFVVRKNLSSVLTVKLMDEESVKPVYKKWWFWTTIGSTIIASSALIYLMNDKEQEKLGLNVSLPMPDGLGGN